MYLHRLRSESATRATLSSSLGILDEISRLSMLFPFGCSCP